MALTKEERFKLGRWITARGLTLGQVGECLVEYQDTHEPKDQSPLLKVWKDASRQIREVEISLQEALNSKNKQESKQDDSKRDENTTRADG